MLRQGEYTNLTSGKGQSRALLCCRLTWFIIIETEHDLVERVEVLKILGNLFDCAAGALHCHRWVL